MVAKNKNKRRYLYILFCRSSICGFRLTLSQRLTMAEERVVCNFHVSRERSRYFHQPLCFKFDVMANRRDFSSDNIATRISSMFTTSILINCNSFLTHDENFLWLNLQRFSSPYLNSENLAQMTLSLISEVKEMFGFSDSLITQWSYSRVPFAFTYSS